ncbi:MAG: acyl-CoA dehydrogenase family protein, partial [Ilumatobacteraceae bacterium]
MADITVEEFEASARAFLDASAPRKESDKKFVWGEGPDKVAVFEEKDREQELADVAKACEWRRTKFDAGFGWVTGPTQYGGAGLTNAHERAYLKLESQYEIPSQGPFVIGLGMVAPTILAHASDVAKDLYLKKMYRADLVGCQLFS